MKCTPEATASKVGHLPSQPPTGEKNGFSGSNFDVVMCRLCWATLTIFEGLLGAAPPWRGSAMLSQPARGGV